MDLGEDKHTQENKSYGETVLSKISNLRKVLNDENQFSKEVVDANKSMKMELKEVIDLLSSDYQKQEILIAKQNEIVNLLKLKVTDMKRFYDEVDKKLSELKKLLLRDKSADVKKHENVNKPFEIEMKELEKVIEKELEQKLKKIHENRENLNRLNKLRHHEGRKKSQVPLSYYAVTSSKLEVYSDDTSVDNSPVYKPMKCGDAEKRVSSQQKLKQRKKARMFNPYITDDDDMM